MPRRKKKYTKAQQLSFYKKQYTKTRSGYQFPKGSFRKVGRNVGSYLGSKSPLAPGIFQGVGGALGASAGSFTSRLVGSGDYNVQQNTILNPNSRVPAFGSDAIRVTRREMIAVVDSNIGFSSLSLPIQPGSDTTFPWLSKIATNYENYHFNGLVFQFVSTSSDSIASTTNLGLGTVALCTDYNASDPPYVNLPQALGTLFSNSGKPSENILHAIECATSQTQQKSYYIRSGDIPANADIKLYDMGNFQFIVDGIADYKGMGQLWVSYDITFFKAVQNNQLGLNLNSDKFVGESPDNTQYFGSTTYGNDQNNIGCIASVSTLSFPVTLNSGYYRISYNARGTVAVTVLAPTLTLTNCSVVTAFNNRTYDQDSNNNTVSTILLFQVIVKITGNNAAVVFSSGFLPGSPTVSDLQIDQVNGDIYDI